MTDQAKLEAIYEMFQGATGTNVSMLVRFRAILDDDGQAPAAEGSRPRAPELVWLLWFAQHADFGPAHEDVMYQLRVEFMRATGMNLPTGWQLASDGETSLDQE